MPESMGSSFQFPTFHTCLWMRNTRHRCSSLNGLFSSIFRSICRRKESHTSWTAIQMELSLRLQSLRFTHRLDLGLTRMYFGGHLRLGVASVMKVALAYSVALHYQCCRRAQSKLIKFKRASRTILND